LVFGDKLKGAHSVRGHWPHDRERAGDRHRAEH
jgi:hypothetical protein